MHNTLRLVTLLAWGLWIPAYAQAPTFSLPTIPGSAAPASSPAMPSSPAPAIPALPGLETLAAPAKEEIAKEETATAEQPAEDKDAALAEVAKLERDIQAAQAAASNESTPLSEAPYQVVPPLALEAPPVSSAEPAISNAAAPPPLFNIPAPPAAMDLAVTSIPEAPVTAATPSKPTWKDVLKPSYQPVKTNFNFRRQVLPSVIYRDQYSNANRHLPLARHGEQYDHYFILAVARNDLNAIRAMLANGRRNVNLMNAEGDPMLIVAIRHNAIAAARLLLARGANPSALGQNGMSAMDYAQYMGNQELINALREHLS